MTSVDPATARRAAVRARAAGAAARLRARATGEPAAEPAGGARTIDPPAARPLTGRLHLHCFDSPVDIVTDRAGVPHVAAASRADRYRAQGFLHFAERAWQIEATARSGQGELAALVGPAALASDAFVHRMRLPDRIAAAVARAPREIRQVMAWYAEGQRAAAGVVPTTAEHAALGRRPRVRDGDEALRDATAIFLLSGLAVQHDWLFDLLRAAVEAAGTSVAATDPAGTSAAPAEPAGTGFRPGGGVDGEPVPPEPARLLAAAYARLGRFAAGGGGSNAWAVAAPRCAEGGPVVAGDPHLGQRLPGVWMAMHLTCPDVDVIGAGMPGVPDVMFGHNGRVAWATTYAPAHGVQLTLEALVDAGTAAVRHGGREPVDRSTRTVAVAGAAAASVETAATSRGTLLGLDLPTAGGIRYDLAVDCPWWTDPYPHGVLARAAESTSAAEFGAVLAGWRGIPLSVVHAERGGDVGTIQVGLRSPSPPPAGLWWGWRPPPAAPADRYRLHTGGPVVVAANATPPGPDEPGHWESPLRARRATALLDQGARTPLAQSVRAQLDVWSPLAADLTPPLVAAVTGRVTGQDAEILAELGRWHGRMYRDLTGPTVFTAWLREIVLAVAAPAGRSVAGQFAESKAWLTDWGLGLVTGWIRTRAGDEAGHAELARLFRVALDRLRRTLGPDPAGWTWRSRHQTRYAHVLDGHPAWPGEPMRLAVPGGDDTLCRGDGNELPAGGPTFRIVVDLARPDESLWSFPAGNSGVPTSPHHADMVDAWAGGRYHRMPYTRAAVRAAAVHTLTILPGGGSPS